MQHLADAPRAHATTAMPPIVGHEEWLAARDALLAREKAHTRAGDALAAERRRLPMERVEGDWTLRGPDGDLSLLDMFEGRRQLVLYHHMLKPQDEHPCPGCSFWGDGVGNLAHLNFSDVTLAMTAQAPLEEIEQYKARMGWTLPFYSWHGSSFGEDLAPSPYGGGSFGINVFLRDATDIYRTYNTWARGAEHLVFGAAIGDITPFGRQQSFEDSPLGWPQAPTYSRGGLHTAFTAEELSGATAPSSTGQLAAD